MEARERAEKILMSKFPLLPKYSDPIGRERIIDAMLEIHKEMMPEELKKFNSWMCGKQYDGVIPMIDACIDEYINHCNENT